MEVDSANLQIIGASLLCMLATAHVAERAGTNKSIIRLFVSMVLFVAAVFFASGTHHVLSVVAKLVWTSKASFRTTASIVEFCKELQSLSAENFSQITILIVSLYLLLQTLCIPGTVVLNAAVGALMGVAVGVPLCVVLGTIGASSCYTLSSLIGVRAVESADAWLSKSKGLPKIRAQVHRYKTDLFVYLLFLRLTPVLPNWLINLASPVVHVPLNVFAAATFCGIIPQTYLSVRFGSFIQSTTTGSVTEGIVNVWDTLLLFVVACAIVLGAKLRKRFLNAPEE